MFQMQVNVINVSTSDVVGQIALTPEIFGLPLRTDILHRVVEWQRAKRQAGTHKTKIISEVSGTTKKPFKQKGTGNARQGSLRSAQMRGGGTIFGPVVRSHAHDLPKKVRALGLKTALSAKAAEGKLLIVQDLKITGHKTSQLVSRLADLGLSSVLVIDGPIVDSNFSKAASNIIGVDVLPQQGANVYDILKHENLVLTQEAVKHLEGRLKSE
jgi:large subunit ribosomal protein L4